MTLIDRRRLLASASTLAAATALSAATLRCAHAADNNGMHYRSVRELAVALAGRKVSSAELVDLAIARIEARDGKLNAVVVRDFGTRQGSRRRGRNPRMSARTLADYMAASERTRRTIVRDCKYRSTARVIQHEAAKMAVAKFIRSGDTDPKSLNSEAERLRERVIADSDFDRDLLDHNADYIDRFATVLPALSLPKAERQAPGQAPPIEMQGVKVGVELHFRLSRVTRTNKVRAGAGMLRYAKRKPLDPDVAV